MRAPALLSEFAECVVAAFEQLAHDPEQGAVAAESLGGPPVEVVVCSEPGRRGGLGVPYVQLTIRTTAAALAFAQTHERDIGGRRACSFPEAAAPPA